MSYESLQKLNQAEFQLQQALEQLQEHDVVSHDIAAGIELQRKQLAEREAAVKAEKERREQIVLAAKQQRELALSQLDSEKLEAAKFYDESLPKLEKMAAELNKATAVYRQKLAEFNQFYHQVDEAGRWIWNKGAADIFHVHPKEVQMSLPIFALQTNGRLAIVSQQEDRGLTPL